MTVHLPATRRPIAALVAGILIAVHLAYNIFGSPMGLPSRPGRSPWSEPRRYYAGIILAQPAILASYATLFRGRDGRPALICFALSLVSGIAIVLGEYLNQGPNFDIQGLYLGFLIAIQFVTLIILLVAAGALTRLWRGRPREVAARPRQISLRFMFAALTAFAVVLGAFMMLVRASDWNGTITGTEFVFLTLSAVVYAVCTLPIAMTIRVTLGGGGPRLIVLLAVALLTETCVLMLLTSLLGSLSSEFLQVLLVMLLAMHGAAILTTLPFRALGFKIGIPPRD